VNSIDFLSRTLSFGHDSTQYRSIPASTWSLWW